MRRSFRVLSIVAPLSIVLAIGLNWLWAPDARQALPGPAIGRAAVPGAVEVKLEKPAVDLIPSRVLTYEVITHQPIPGYGKTAGEAVYKTLNMNLEAQVAMVIYVRVEGFNSAAEAKGRVDELMKPYSANFKKTTINKATPAVEGEAPNGSVWAVGWVRGNYATLIKSSFAEWTPPDRVDLIRNVGTPVVDATDVFQRTGREGVTK